MKRLIALPTVIGLLALAGPAAASAASPVTQQTIPVQSAFQSPSVTDPCNGAVITWTGNVHLLGVTTTDAAGGIVLTAHIDFQGVQGTDPAGNKYTLALASNEVLVLAPSSPNLGSTPNVVTKVLQFQIIGNGSAPNFYEYEVGHFTILPDGTMTVSFDNVSPPPPLSCSS